MGEVGSRSVLVTKVLVSLSHRLARVRDLLGECCSHRRKDQHEPGAAQQRRPSYGAIPDGERLLAMFWAELISVRRTDNCEREGGEEGQPSLCANSCDQPRVIGREYGNPPEPTPTQLAPAVPLSLTTMTR